MVFQSRTGPHPEGAAMPTRNVNLTDELDRFVLKKVESGLYENASEVVRAALRTLEREEQQYEAKLSALRGGIDDGDLSGLAEGDVFKRVWETLELPASPRYPLAVFRFFRRAESDMLGIAGHTLRTRGVDQTIRYLDDLGSCCRLLADNPALGRSCADVRAPRQPRWTYSARASGSLPTYAVAGAGKPSTRATIVGERRSHARTRASSWRISVQTIAPNVQEWSDA
jgi:antitoxin ParD1/3/4